MAKHGDWNKASSFFTEGFLFVGRATVALLVVWALWSFVDSNFSSTITVADFAAGENAVNLDIDPPNPTFYDDRDLSYSLDRPIKNWDRKRREWLKHHPSFAAGVGDRVLMVTGSQPSPCQKKLGDHMLFRFFKNKVDYGRIHGYDIFYNNALLHPKMDIWWAKLPLIRAAMVAHPEAEWIWWLDSDAAFTDMEFKLPLHKYNSHNLVIHGWPRAIFEEKTWTSLNAGVFLIRNCQWSLDFMDMWGNMGPISPDFKRWGKTLSSTFKERGEADSDDQSALVYLILKEKDTWGKKIYIESAYYFEGYWVSIMPTLENITEGYLEMEKGVRTLRRRRAEKVSWSYGALREQHMKKKKSLRRPFITHFAGCQPCNGEHNSLFTEKECWDSMKKALNFGDNQVLRNFGFMHPRLLDSSVTPVPFNFPA